MHQNLPGTGPRDLKKECPENRLGRLAIEAVEFATSEHSVLQLPLAAEPAVARPFAVAGLPLVVFSMPPAAEASMLPAEQLEPVAVAMPPVAATEPEPLAAVAAAVVVVAAAVVELVPLGPALVALEATILQGGRRSETF